jgi:hypothetical protein
MGEGSEICRYAAGLTGLRLPKRSASNCCRTCAVAPTRGSNEEPSIPQRRVIAGVAKQSRLHR